MGQVRITLVLMGEVRAGSPEGRMEITENHHVLSILSQTTDKFKKIKVDLSINFTSGKWITNFHEMISVGTAFGSIGYNMSWERPGLNHFWLLRLIIAFYYPFWSLPLRSRSFHSCNFSRLNCLWFMILLKLRKSYFEPALWSLTDFTLKVKSTLMSQKNKQGLCDGFMNSDHEQLPHLGIPLNQIKAHGRGVGPTATSVKSPMP